MLQRGAQASQRSRDEFADTAAQLHSNHQVGIVLVLYCYHYCNCYCYFVIVIVIAAFFIDIILVTCTCKSVISISGSICTVFDFIYFVIHYDSCMAPRRCRSLFPSSPWLYMRSCVRWVVFCIWDRYPT